MPSSDYVAPSILAIYARDGRLQNVKDLVAKNHDVNQTYHDIHYIGLSRFNALYGTLQALATQTSKTVKDHKFIKDLTEVAKFLIEQNITINISEDDACPSSQLIRWAIEAGNLELVKLLIQKGATVTEDLLVAAIDNNNLDIIDCLLEKISVDAKINYKTFDVTPLHIATDKNNEKVVAFLLEKGAGPNVVYEGNDATPLDVAIRNNNSKIRDLLKRHSGQRYMDLSVTNENTFYTNREEAGFIYYDRRTNNPLSYNGYKLRVSINADSLKDKNVFDNIKKILAANNIQSYKVIDLSQPINPNNKSHQRFIQGAQITIYLCDSEGQLSFKNICQSYKIAHDLQKFLKNQNVPAGKIPKSDVALNKFISGRYDRGDTVDTGYLEEDSAEFKTIRLMQHTMRFFACVDDMQKLKFHAETDKNIQNFLSELEQQPSFKAAKQFIIIKHEELCSQDESFSKSPASKLIESLQKNLDRHELRAVRDYANDLNKKTKDPLALRKAELLHKMLDDLMDETSPDIIKGRLDFALKSVTFTQHRHTFHIGETHTAGLIKTALKNITKSEEVGLFPFEKKPIQISSPILQ